MDFTSLIAGPAQAGPQSPVSKPGIGFTAGAGSAPATGAAGDAGFASLVALALDQMDGDALPGCSASPVCYAPGDGAAEVDSVASEGEDESPLDAPVDAATLSLLIALTTPVAAPVATPAPEVVGQGSADLPAVEGDAARTTVNPSVDASAQPTTASSTPSAPSAPSASAFDDARATATPAAAPGADAPASPVATPEAHAEAPAPTPTAAAATPETLSAPANAPANAQANAPAPTAEPAAAPPPAAAAPRAGQRPAAHPLRQALAAIAAAAPAPAPAPADSTSPAAVQPDAAIVASRQSGAIAPPSVPAAAATAGSHEARAAAVSRVDAAAALPVAAFGAASDAGSAGDGSSDGASDRFAAANAPAPSRGAEGPVNLPAFPASTATLADGASTALQSHVGFGSAGDTMLRAIEMPAAARFEQALSSVDPDVRNLQAMVRTVRLFTAGNGAHEARLNLEPEHLGPVALTVRVEQGSVSAHFRAETPAAQRWIETHQQELRAGLRDQGLEVKELVVTTDPDGRRDRRQDAQPARPPRARRPQSADEPRFEVLV